MPSLPNESDASSSLSLGTALTYQSNGSNRRKIRKKRKTGIITANVAGTKYEIGRWSM
ncbi:hypothetical protein GDO81_024826 [Engystomops pustulosus]|uniref:Uncharacterized protein n=1 Tax=Engystomops pustulosus TaxID=76066 RepID=A0AAV6YPT6_ENGPU|nr:hypothetical protein GDO81_024826 [Engystomops pustulosus]